MGKALLNLFLVQFFVLYASAQSFSVKGRVVSAETNEALPGVSIKVTGRNQGTQTDASGGFSLELRSETELEFVYVGYSVQKVKATRSQPILTVRLHVDEASLKEVLITGYSVENKTRYAGSAGVVTASQINQVPVGSFDQTLQGRVPGLYVTSGGNGTPGAAARLVVRGTNTTGITQPIFIVDGVPVESSILFGINSSDIETVSVLKDAASTSLYGSRGSNGVIVVTTKKGKQGPTSFRFKTQTGVSNLPSERFRMLNAAQRLQFEEEVGLDIEKDIGPGWSLSENNPANKNLSAEAKGRNAAILDSLRNNEQDWRSVFFRDGKFQEYDVSATGGNEAVRFYSSLNYFGQDGIARRSYLNRYSFRSNVDFTGKNVVANLNIAASLSKTSGITPTTSGTSPANPVAATYYALPYERPYINGVLYHTQNRASAPVDSIYDIREGSNALEKLLDSKSLGALIKSLITGSVKYTFNKNLSSLSSFGIDFRENNATGIIYAGTYFGSLVSTGKQGQYEETSNRTLQYVLKSGLNFKETFNNRHEVDLDGIFEVNRLQSKLFYLSGYGINPKLNDSPAGITSTFAPVVIGSRTQNALVSFIGIGRYSFDQKYNAHLSYRYDGSSIVGRDNRWSGFYSAGFSWNAKRENFLKDVDEVTDLRLRLSYGKTAAPFSANNFNYVSAYQPSKYSGAAGIIASAPGNSDYNWESTYQTDIGTDFGFFRGRYRATVDWYHKITTNAFLDQVLAAESGFTSQLLNTGKIRNNGIEVDLSADVLKNRDWQVTLGTNFGYNKNMVLDMGEANEYILGTTIVRKGLPLGTQYHVRYAGVDPLTGDALYYNKDGSTTSVYNQTTQSVPLDGSYFPPFFGGITGLLRFKQVTVDALFSFANGFYRLSNEESVNDAYSAATSNKTTNILRRWRSPGDITDVQRFDPNSIRRVSSKDLFDASYIKLKNIRVIYDLPAGALSALKVKAARIYLQGQNLHTWSQWPGVDPEDSNNIAQFEYPTARTYSIGLNVNF